MLDGIPLAAIPFVMASLVGREWFEHWLEPKISKRWPHAESRRQRVERYRLWQSREWPARLECAFAAPAPSRKEGVFGDA
jgi:hypothetical protein